MASSSAGPLSPRRSIIADPHATRPSLQRLASDLTLAALQPSSSTNSVRASDGARRSLDELGPWTRGGSGEADRPREALIHVLAKGDSLAGIALQYGTTAQALRQANRLWSTDSIHLRKELFIPLDACTMPPAKEIIERIETEGDTVRIYSRALPKRPPPVIAPAPPPLINGSSAGRRSASLDLERLVSSSRTSLDSSGTDAARDYLPETNVEYLASPELPSSPGGTLVDVEEPLAPLVERVLKLGIVPPPPASTQPFFRISPSTPKEELPPVKATAPRPAPADALPMRSHTSGWGVADDDELRLAMAYVKKTSSRSSKGWR